LKRRAQKMMKKLKLTPQQAAGNALAIAGQNIESLK